MRFIANFAVKQAKDKFTLVMVHPNMAAVLEFEGFGTKAYVTILGENKNE